MTPRYWTILAIAMFVLILLVWYFLSADKKERFEARRLLTENEEEFFGRLVRALPEFYVFPQVAFRAFLKPGDRSSRKAYASQLGRIGAKHCDFMICNHSLDIMAIIELDDRTHLVAQDIARDAMTESAGYTTIRYDSRCKPPEAEIRSDIKHMLSR